MSKTLSMEFSGKERFAVYVHFSRNVSTNSAKEQDEYGDLWDDFGLDAIEDFIDVARDKGERNDVSEVDFADEKFSLVVELTKDEAGHFIAFCGRPMAGALSRKIRPLRQRVAEARDKAGMKAVPAEG